MKGKKVAELQIFGVSFAFGESDAEITGYYQLDGTNQYVFEKLSADNLFATEKEAEDALQKKKVDGV